MDSNSGVCRGSPCMQGFLVCSVRIHWKSDSGVRLWFMLRVTLHAGLPCMPSALCWGSCMHACSSTSLPSRVCHTLLPSQFYHHTFAITISPSHFRHHTFAITISPSHFCHHNFAITLLPSRFCHHTSG